MLYQLHTLTNVVSLHTLTNVVSLHTLTNVSLHTLTNVVSLHTLTNVVSLHTLTNVVSLHTLTNVVFILSTVLGDMYFFCMKLTNLLSFGNTLNWLKCNKHFDDFTGTRSALKIK